MQSGCWALPFSYPMCTGVKWSGREAGHLTLCALALRIGPRVHHLEEEDVSCHRVTVALNAERWDIRSEVCFGLLYWTIV